MTEKLEAALEAARDAETWRLAVEFGSNVSLLDEGHVSIAARYFNTLVHFLSPTTELPEWRLAWGSDTGENDDEIDVLGQLTVAQVIDTVPYLIEQWVLSITREAAEYFAEAHDEDLRQAGIRLHSEHEQGEAISARRQARADARYGDTLMYDFPADAELHYERSELQGQPALVVGETGDGGVRVLHAPSAHHPWRWSVPGHVDEYGERLTVQDAIERAGIHEDWVREHTAYALGDTLAALRAVQGQALFSNDPTSLRELARLAGHAQALAEGLDAPLA